MKERHVIEKILLDYFAYKIERFNFYNQTDTKNRVEEIAQNTIDAVDDAIAHGDGLIDNILEEFDSTAAREDYIRTTKMDLAYEDKVNKDLGVL